MSAYSKFTKVTEILTNKETSKLGRHIISTRTRKWKLSLWPFLFSCVVITILSFLPFQITKTRLQASYILLFRETSVTAEEHLSKHNKNLALLMTKGSITTKIIHNTTSFINCITDTKTPNLSTFSSVQNL